MNAGCALVVIRLPAHSLSAYPCERFNFKFMAVAKEARAYCILD